MLQKKVGSNMVEKRDFEFIILDLAIRKAYEMMLDNFMNSYPS